MTTTKVRKNPLRGISLLAAGLLAASTLFASEVAVAEGLQVLRSRIPYRV